MVMKKNLIISTEITDTFGLGANNSISRSVSQSYTSNNIKKICTRLFIEGQFYTRKKEKWK